MVEPQLSRRGEVIVDVRTNSLIIKDTPAALIGEINELIVLRSISRRRRC